MKKNYTLFMLLILLFNVGFCMAKPTEPIVDRKLVLPSATMVIQGNASACIGSSPTLQVKFTGSGGIGQMVGKELKFNPANAKEGLFFISDSGVETKVTVLANRTEGKLVFSIPTLPAGSYSLEVRKGYDTTNIVVRSGSLQDALQVV